MLYSDVPGSCYGECTICWLCDISSCHCEDPFYILRDYELCKCFVLKIKNKNKNGSSQWLRGDNEILQSQPGYDTWQGEISFIFKAPNFYKPL
jgi:hypothetical protein